MRGLPLESVSDSLSRVMYSTGEDVSTDSGAFLRVRDGNAVRICGCGAVTGGWFSSGRAWRRKHSGRNRDACRRSTKYVLRGMADPMYSHCVGWLENSFLGTTDAKIQPFIPAAVSRYCL